MKEMYNINRWESINSAFTNIECDKIQALCDKVSLEKSFTIEKKIFNGRKSKSGWIDHNDKSTEIYNLIYDKVIRINSQKWNFNLDGGIEKLHYLEYGFGQFFWKHIDNGHDTVSCRKLTAVIQLSNKNDYVGGGLKIWGANQFKQISFKNRGTLTIFPSHLFHQASPVFWGKRKSLVCWFNGKEPLK